MGTALGFGKTPLSHCKSRFFTSASLKVKHNGSGPATHTASFYFPLTFVKSPVRWHKKSGKAAMLEAAQAESETK